MTVYIVETHDYDGDYTEGVYATLEAAKGSYPDVQWEEVRHFDGSLWWLDAKSSLSITPHDVRNVPRATGK